MADLTAVVLDALRLYGPLVLCLFTFLETSMLFPFLPSEVVVPAAAAILVTDRPSFLVFVAAAGVGGTVGAFVPFYVFADTRAGRLRRHIAVSDARLQRGQRWFRRWGPSTVLWGRFLPVLRSVVSIPAGLARMDPLAFGLFTAVGTVGFYAVTAAVVYYSRHQALFQAAVAVATDRPALALLALAAVALLVDRVVGR